MVFINTMPDYEQAPQYDFSEYPRLKKPWFKRPLVYIFIIVAIFLGYFSFKLGLAYNSITIENQPWWKTVAGIFGVKDSSPKEDLNPMPKPEPDRFDVLILGIRGENAPEEGGLLTDTILVVSADKINKKTAIISIPRDLYIDISAYTADGRELKVKSRINEVYEKGLPNGGGLALTKQIISRMSGIYIDKAIVFDFNAFKEIVDDLGGIDIYLAKPFKESTQWGYEFSLPAGNNHLNGEQALYYVRSRFSTSDFDRAKRQQEVIIAIKNKALSLGVLSNPVKISSILSSLKGNIRTDFQIWDINDILTLAGSFNPKQPVKTYVISIDNLVHETHTTNGEYILLPKDANYGGIKNLFKNILSQ